MPDVKAKVESGVTVKAEGSGSGIAVGNGPSRNDQTRMNGNRGRQNQRGRGQNGRGGARGGRGRGSSRGRGGDRSSREESHRRGEQGRAEWARNPVDKRKRNEEDQETKRRRLENGEDVESLVGVKYSVEEIAGEIRKPKRKVAVLIGYAGTGYKGMQLNDKEKTIEGDLFNAFVKAGAISKANADDPKKSSLVRCARTDKGVHAAGNIVSLKLIVEDPDLVTKINEHLPPQIRVWGYERTNAAFSCYQSCDSRWYEYLIPTYSFIPPHPKSFLGKKIVESVENEGVLETYQALQEDISKFWEETECNLIDPILAKLTPEVRKSVLEVMYAKDGTIPTGVAADVRTDETMETSNNPLPDNAGSGRLDATSKPEIVSVQDQFGGVKVAEPAFTNENMPEPASEPQVAPVEATLSKSTKSSHNTALAETKAAYITAKKAYRISSARRQRVQDALNKYLGTQNFHNYTIQKTFHDPSAKRVIRSFNVGTTPIIINDTEWLSLKVHGQSFMMHQIRKMVAMATLVVRCGTPLERISQSYGSENMSIPKAPALGLLLERPVFDSYNERAVRDLDKEKIDFGKFEKQIEEFKEREIYQRIFRVENEENHFHVFFHHLDHFRTNNFLWVTAGGLAESSKPLERIDDGTIGVGGEAAMEAASDDDEAPGGGEEG